MLSNLEIVDTNNNSENKLCKRFCYFLSECCENWTLSFWDW